MKAKKTVCICISLFASLGLWSCNKENAETPSAANSELPKNAIGFSILQNIGGERPTKADITGANLTEMFVCAHNTGTSDFTTSSTPDVMLNQLVMKGSNGVWTYSPLQFWPDDESKISFFAIAPKPESANGIVQNLSGGSYSGYPSFTVSAAANPSEQKDIVLASAMNRTKTGGDVALTFKHVLTKVSFTASYKGTLSGSGYVKVKHLWLERATGGTLRHTSGNFSWDTPNLAYDHFSEENGTLAGSALPANSSSPGGMNLFTASNPLLLVPQTNATVQLLATVYDGTIEKDYGITTTLSLDKTGEQVTHHLVIDLSLSHDPVQVWNYSYNTGSTVSSGATNTFTAPETGYYQLEAWGAGGSNGYGDYGYGAPGGYSKGIVFLNSGQTLYIYVGGYKAHSGGDGTNYQTFNGGGRNTHPDTGNHRRSGIGGGATDFRLKSGTWSDATSLNSRILIAAGGGGGGAWLQDKGAHGGAGGGLNGSEGITLIPGAKNAQGGSQSAGGVKSTPVTEQAETKAQNGFFGKGGGINWHGGGGGGGYYGGGNGNYGTGTSGTSTTGGGGGGASFISGMKNCIAIQPDATNDPRTPDATGNLAALNYSNTTFGASNSTWQDGDDIVFTNCSMIDGAGFEWNTGAKGVSTKMPNPTTAGAGMTGNTGNGYARITLLIKQ